ncbi:hypothetical protein GWG65_33050 [Bradyrhizobium sp. CSA207]|uniref:ThiF family adenylyltransferase n=1 Tax=Bradyrhizobium sp. CSA207 TaxID=2698826 RepID=UPI0023AEACF0|nr:ThiF family adenylyltransferase [Bradyrhizobium sp. CSA207]MDE5446141.1 hypothetical protein [Bradyrhizobium sp. CSA207]
MTWYLTDVARFRAERQVIEILAQTVDWFSTTTWRFDDRLRLVLDAEIEAGGRIYPIYLQYPDMFPHTPPSVFPRGDGTRWSSHQFGAGGELCLEYGPDTWTPDLGGKDLIESCHRLLQLERPTGGERRFAPSRHAETLGQQLRSRYSRFVVTRAFQAFIEQLPLRIPLTASLVSIYHKEAVVHVVESVKFSEETSWADQSVPSQLASEYMQREIPICRWPASDGPPSTVSLDAFGSCFAALGAPLKGSHALVVHGTQLSVYFLDHEHNAVIEVAILQAEPDLARLDADHAALVDKKVGLIGCGSLGSKVGSMLARAGVAQFLLIDDDILLPDNFVRNDLDWRDAGAHKVPALARRLQMVNPSADVIQWRARLAAQEANESAEAMLSRISQCDLIIDATADPNVLNLVSAVGAAANKPILWAEVFGGGIGGLIARSRPGLEPSPPYMRRAIENWFGERGAPPARPARPYEANPDGAEPLIADDADVSAIAAHAARFALDLLIGRTPSMFPYSVYAIGLGVGSVFSQPFETFPIDVGPPPPEPPTKELSSEETAAEFAALVALLKDKLDGTTSAPPGRGPAQM